MSVAGKVDAVHMDEPVALATQVKTQTLSLHLLTMKDGEANAVSTRRINQT